MKYAIVNISDIHYRKNEPEGASTLIEAFIQDIEEQKNKFSDYKFYLAITGDIVFEGNDNESYEKFSHELDKALNEIELPKECRIMVPGNHDLDRNIVIENFEDHLRKLDKFSITEKSLMILLLPIMLLIINLTIMNYSNQSSQNLGLIFPLKDGVGI